MEAVVLVIHLIVALGIIAVVLLQRSEGGGLGIGGSGGGLGNFASQRATANALTRLTTWLGTAFVVTSLTLAILATQRSAEQPGSILDVKTPQLPLTVPAKDKETIEGGVQELKQEIENAAEKTEAAVEDAAEEVKDKAAEVNEAAKEAVEEVKDKAAE